MTLLDELGSLRERGSRVLILRQMTLAQVILEDYLLFEHYSKSFVIPFVIPWLLAPENDPNSPL